MPLIILIHTIAGRFTIGASNFVLFFGYMLSLFRSHAFISEGLCDLLGIIIDKYHSLTVL